MAILIDSFINGQRGPVHYWNRKCGHLVSDVSLEELHDFARRLGLKPEWFQQKSIPHYDVTGDRYEMALKMGAALVTTRELAKRAVREEKSRVKAVPFVRKD